MAKTKEKKTKPLPEGWIAAEGPDGWKAEKHFTESSLVAYGKDEQELLAAVENYEERIERGLITPR